MKPQIAVMRAREDAKRTSEALAARGLTAVIAPVIAFRATGACVPESGAEALALTSVKAVQSLSEDSLRRVSGRPLYAVGARIDAVARDLGLTLAAPPARDVAELLSVLRARLPRASRVLYLAAGDRKSDLERGLVEAGHVVEVVEVYAADPRLGWDAEEAAAIAGCDAALHFSERSAELAARFAALGGIGLAFLAMPHVVISRDAASPLRAAGAPRIYWSAEPVEDAMLDTLETALADRAARRS